MMENSVDKDNDYKQGLDVENLLCRCCLAIERPMLNATAFNQFFMDLAGINVLATDGLPQWICYECSFLIQKATKFKYKMLRVQTMLYEYITRCAPFPIDANDPELAKYASPYLCSAKTLVFDSDTKKKLGFHKVLEHEKIPVKSEITSIEILPANISKLDTELEENEYDDIKAEQGLSDFEDDVPLQEFRSTVQHEMKNDDIDTKINVDVKIESNVKIKRKDSKSRRMKKREVEPKKKSIRKPIEIDPSKIRVVILNPEEQFRQRQEESKELMKFTHQCHLCYKGFNFESKLQNHMKKHSPSRGPYECKICHMFLPNSYSFNVHTLIHTRRFECLACGVRMIDKSSINHHYKAQHEGIETVITCELCGKMSSNIRTHRGHMRNHHSGERPKCDQCGKSFVNKDSLTDHMQIHEGVKNYECSTCGKRCRTRTQIKHHQLMHTDVKLYYCVECDVRFKSSGSLRQHLLKSLKHKDVESLTFVCTGCPRRYSTAAALASHTRVQHEGVREHSCATCGAALASRASLHKHMALHEHAWARPSAHVCHCCGRSFTAKSVLTNHMRTHTGEKPFPCDACGRCFAQRTAMRTHMRRVHHMLHKTKLEPGLEPQPAPPAPKEVPPAPAPVWSRPQEIFYVTAGP